MTDGIPGTMLATEIQHKPENGKARAQDGRNSSLLATTISKAASLAQHQKAAYDSGLASSRNNAETS